MALGLTVLVSSDASAWHHRHGGSVIIYGGPAYAPVYPYAYPYPYYAYPPPVYGVPAPAYVAPPAYISPPQPTYVSPPTPAPAPTAAPAQQTSDCREYQTTITVAGRQQPAYGVTCRQPDGSWRIVTDAAPR